jgi:parallel beta-helix repeat protein
MKKNWRIIVALSIVLLSFNALVLTFQTVKAEPTTWTVASSGNADFRSIQAAINGVNAGDTIFVKSGTYLESVIVNKSVNLIGAGAKSTFIFGISSAGAVTVAANGVSIANFSISNPSQITSPALTVNNYSNITIANNTIANSQTGMAFYGSSNVYIANNTITKNTYAIYTDRTTHDNIFCQNNITQNTVGFYLYYSYNNTFFFNTIAQNALQVMLIGTPQNNWDNGYPSGGNYWSGYTGVDQNLGLYQNITTKDGIGDTPYVIGVNNTDNYPLMQPYLNLPGDLNKDGKVDFQDLVYFVTGYISYWQTFTIEPQYKLCDLSGDGIINIIDLVFFAQDYISYQQAISTH